MTIEIAGDQDRYALCRSILIGARLGAWTSQIDSRYQTLETARHIGGTTAVNELVTSGEKFVPTASSLTVGAALSDENLGDLFAGISAGPAGAWIRRQLQGHVACDLDQAWVRRRYTPGHYPPLHTPHGWHQDGALGFDFLSHRDRSFPPDVLLSMVTCWIALGPCGVDAPGLEIVTRRLEGLLAPPELTDERVHARFEPDEFWRPVMETGDALLFRGDILHRTHVTPAMTKDRTSIELRFFPTDKLPARLKGDRFVAFN